MFGSLNAQKIIDGCSYEYYLPLLITAPTTGFTISEQTCGLLIPKEAFREQPFVYFPNAKDVSLCYFFL